MKYKVLTLCAFLAAAGTVSAQTATDGPKWTDNIYVGAGVGAMTVMNDGMNTPTFNLNINLGKQISPVWGVRAGLGGFSQTLSKVQSNGYSCKNKTAIELNLDATMSLVNLLAGYNADRKADFYIFAGPTINFSNAVNGSSSTVTTIKQDGTTSTTGSSTFAEDGMKARVGATVGAGLSYMINDKWAINLEARYGVTPSVFGMGSDCRTAESTLRGNIGFAYTFGGRHFKKATQIVEKEVIREVPKEVIKEVTKEVKVEVPAATNNAVTASAIFFRLGRAELSKDAQVNIKLIADAIKKSNGTFTVVGSADKGTGTTDANQKLSEKRAQVVYDALIAEGVPASKLQKSAEGGVDNKFFNDPALSRVTIIEVK